jgi:hypothetical protein
MLNLGMRFRILPIALILILGIISILSFSGMSTMDHEEEHRCPISFVLVGDCPSTLGGWAFVSHHVSGFQYAMRSILSTQAGALFFLMFFVAYLFFAHVGLLWMAILHLFIHQYFRLHSFLSLSPPRQLLRWFALRNKRASHPAYVTLYALT